MATNQSSGSAAGGNGSGAAAAMGGAGVGGNGGAGAGGAASSSSSGGVGGHPLWINEIHYDNTGTDTGEGIELAGAAGVDLSQYQLELHNGGGPALYDTIALSGTLPNQQGGYGSKWFAVASNGLQNGPSDGIALVVKATGDVVQFLSYEGTLTASDGGAKGAMSVDIGLVESSSTPAGQSLQLTGSGNTAQSFQWSGPLPATPGQPNDGQTFQ